MTYELSHLRALEAEAIHVFREVAAQLVQAAGLRSPATIVVGHVVGLREQLGWFDREPAVASPPPANTTPMEVALT